MARKIYTEEIIYMHPDRLTSPTDSPINIERTKNKSSINEPKYKSLEAFIFQNFPEQADDDYTTHDRNVVQYYRRHLKKALQDLGIDLQLFNREKSFYITQDVSELFLYVLKSVATDRDMLKRLKNEETACLYYSQLIELRNLLAYALESIKTPLDDFIQALHSFEKATNCPPLWNFVPYTNIVTEAVNYWKVDYEDQLSDFQWINFMRSMEYAFRDFWRPKFIEYVGRELHKCLQALKEGIPQDNPSEIGKQEKSEL